MSRSKLKSSRKRKVFKFTFITVKTGLKCRREERTIVYKPETNLDNDRYKPTHSSTFGASSGFMRALNCYVNCTTTR